MGQCGPPGKPGIGLEVIRFRQEERDERRGRDSAVGKDTVRQIDRQTGRETIDKVLVGTNDYIPAAAAAATLTAVTVTRLWTTSRVDMHHQPIQ